MWLWCLGCYSWLLVDCVVVCYVLLCLLVAGIVTLSFCDWLLQGLVVWVFGFCGLGGLLFCLGDVAV